ncbi:MAG: hypothetical protein GEU94_01400 [Micromonosporaceae bacterium]|nr:hypothetical protein [Micromonosporaceae bacterium]
MQVTLVPPGHSAGARELVNAMVALECTGADAVWFAGTPTWADETGVIAAAFTRTATLRLGVPVGVADNVFWAARRIGTLSWAAPGRLDVVFTVARPADEPVMLAHLMLLRQMWSDPAFAERVQVRPAGTGDQLRPVVFGPDAEAIATSVRATWAAPRNDGIRGGAPDGTRLEVSWLPT